MKNKLVSLVILPLFLTGLAGRSDFQSLNEKPIINHKTEIVLAQSDYPQFCDCLSISNKIYDAYKDLAELKEIEASSLEELQNNPNDSLEKKYLEDSLMLQKVITGKKNELIGEGKNCGCYERKL
jgi:hypothetical protein